MTVRVALVTGASRGIGRETALALAAKGITVYAVAEGTGPELRDIAAACGADVRFGMFDLSVPGQAAAMVAAALAACGRTHGRPEAIAVLATTTDGFIHGHDLVVDGGYIIH